MPDHPFGILSLMPPMVAIALAILTRRVVLSLIAGIFVGALIMTGNPLRALHDTWEIHLWNVLVDPGRLRVFSFTLAMGSLIGVITRSGGMQGLINLITPWAKNRRRGQITTWLLGMVVFFDDYANTILLGSTLRPVCDRLKISREKLAYLVDSTAAPVAGLALISTWVAVEIEYVRNGLANIDPELGQNAFPMFISSIPYRFYILFALLFVPMIAIFGRDFGPMWKAEKKRIEEDVIDEQHPDSSGLESPKASGWYNGALPIIVALGVTVWWLWRSGYYGLSAEERVGADFRAILGAADSSLALQYGALLGLITASLMALSQKLLDSSQLVEAIAGGARVVAPAIAILWCASAVSTMTGSDSIDGAEATAPYEFKSYRLYTGDYLKAVLTGTTEEDAAAESRVSVKWLPTIVFVLSGFVAFCTGTSWGTMGILLPMVVPLAHLLLQGTTNPLEDPIMYCSVGGVLAGAVFGDHCSPISDTTVLSSQSCACNHIAHVWTQMPYAILVAVISILLGTIPIGFGVPVMVLLPLQLTALVVMLFVLGRKVEES